MSTSVAGSARSGSRPRTTRSASFPGVIDPLRCSSNDAKAPFRVPTRIASSTVMRWCGPQRFPFISVRVAIDCSAIIRLEWTGRIVRAKRRPHARIDEAPQGEHVVEALGAVLAHLLAVKVHVGGERRRNPA